MPMSKMVSFRTQGDFKKLNSFFERCLEIVDLGFLDKYGRRGCDALAAATPKDTGLASSSWTYDIIRDKGSVRIEWHNSDVEGGYNVAILVQYGHATRSGGFVEGIDFINPALEPIFIDIAKEAWEEVNRL